MSLNTVFKVALGKRRLAAIGNPVVSSTLKQYVDLLKTGTPFSFSRFGDGEWAAILDRPGKNCDGHEYYPELGHDLRQALLHPYSYMYAMQPRAIKTDCKDIVAFLDKNGVKISWHNSDVFHTANGEGRLLPLVNQLRKMKVVLIGPDYLRSIKSRVFSYDYFIEIPRENCYLSKDKILSDIVAQEQKSGSTVFAFSASMTANVLIHELFKTIGKTSWLIDFGSLWDVYSGELSRGYFTQGNWENKIKKNLGNL